MLVKLMPVTSGGMRLKPVLPEAGTANSATRKPSAFCQWTDPLPADRTPVVDATNSNTGQILLLISTILTGNDFMSVLLQEREIDQTPAPTGRRPSRNALPG